ncbi:MAG: hypothetical protein QXO16_01605 [Archaeoglobaceae archaeon]
MREEKIVQKWRIIKISRSKPSLAFRILEKIPTEFEEEIRRIAFEYGLEKGREVAKNLKLSFAEVAKFISMLSGTRVEVQESLAVFSLCPVNSLELIRLSPACRGFLEGFFRAFNLNVEVSTNCGEKCRVEVRLRTRP